MKNRVFSSVVPLPFSISKGEDYGSHVLMNTDQFHSSLGGVRHVLICNHVDESESLPILKLVQKAKAILKSADSFKFNRVNSKFIIESQSTLKDLLSEIEDLSKSNKIVSIGGKIALDRLFSTANSMKAFVDNCLVKNFI